MRGEMKKKITYGDVADTFYCESFLCFNTMEWLTNQISSIIKCDTIVWDKQYVNKDNTYYRIKIVRGNRFYTITIFGKELTHKEMKLEDLLYQSIEVLLRDLSCEWKGE